MRRSVMSDDCSVTEDAKCNLATAGVFRVWYWTNLGQIIVFISSGHIISHHLQMEIPNDFCSKVAGIFVALWGSW